MVGFVVVVVVGFFFWFFAWFSCDCALLVKRIVLHKCIKIMFQLP